MKSLSPAQRLKLANELAMSRKSKPVRRIWILKPEKSEKRPLGIPTMTDRAKQALAKLALEPEWEAKFVPNTHGFRPARSCHDAIEAIYHAICQKKAYVLDADIKGCFDNIDHTALLKKINTFPKLRRVVKGWLKNGVMEGDVFQETKAGTPQGGVISPLLANVAFYGLKYELKEAIYADLRQYTKQKVKSIGSRDTKRNISIVFYADDFVVIHESKEIILKAKEYIERWLGRIGLKLSPTKTRIVHTLQPINGDNKPGFNFLGFSIRQYSTEAHRRKFKTHTKPSLENQKRHRRTT